MGQPELRSIGPLEDAFLRVNRASQHLANLKRRVKMYVDAQQDAMVVRAEGMTAQTTFPEEPPPRFLGILIGETIQGLRTALDYLVYGLAWFDSGPEVKRKTQFPIEDRPESFKGRQNTFLKGVSAKHVAAIERLQPYNGGSWLADIRELSNLDKHNILVVAAGATGTSVIAVGLSDEEAESLGGFRKAGDDVGMYYKLPMVVTFPGGAPVIQVLELFTTETRSLLQAFEPEFEGWQDKAMPLRKTTHTQVVGPLPELSPPG